MFTSAVRGRKTFAAEQKIRELKIKCPKIENYNYKNTIKFCPELEQYEK